MVLISDYCPDIIILTRPVFLSQLLFSVVGQWAGDEGAGQTLVSSAGSHASRGRAELQCTEREVGF